MLRCRLKEEPDSSGHCQYISHRRIVINVFSNNIIFSPACLHGGDTENFAFTFDNLKTPAAIMNHNILSNCCRSHTLHPSIHTYFRRIREQCHLPPVTSHDLSSAQLHRFRIDSTQHGAQKASVLGPGTPVTKANSDNTPFQPY